MKIKLTGIRIIAAAICLCVCYACPFGDDDVEIEQLDVAEFYETEDAEFPIIAIDEDGKCIGINKSCTEVSIMLSNGDLMYLSLDDNNLPETAIIFQDYEYYLVVFSEFEGDNYDIGIINLNTNKEYYFTDLVFTGANDLRSQPKLVSSPLESIECLSSDLYKSGEAVMWDFESWWEMYGAVTIKTIGQAIDGASCAISIAATAGTFGAATGIAVITCGTFASSLIIDKYTEDELAEKRYTKGVKALGKFGEATLKCTQSKSKCIMGVAGELYSIYSFAKTDVNSSVIHVVREKIKGYRETGGLIGQWDADEKNQAGVIVNQSYVFNSDKTGYISVVAESDVSGYYAKTTITMNFRYNVTGENILTVDMTSVVMHTLAKQNGQILVNEYSDPMSYSEYTNGGAGYGPTNINETWRTTYEIYGDNGVLRFEDGQTLIRYWDF